MRHRKSGRKLNRTNSHRKAMLRNMARALLTYERIRTTEAKAKELRGLIDSLVTLAIRNDLHSRRLAYKALNNHQLVQKLFDEIGPRFEGGTGGYTRILKLSQPRRGDAAPMVVIELTKLDGEEEKALKKKAPAKKAAAKKAAPKKEEAAKDEPKEEVKDEAKEEKPKKAPAKKAAAKKAPAKKAAAKKAPAKKAAAKKAAAKKDDK